MKEKLEDYIGQVKNLPPSPALVVELVNLLKKPDRDIDQLVNLLSRDPAITAEILRLCNSAYFGSNEPATDLFEATFRLGFYEVYQVSIALSGSRTLRWWGAHQGLNLQLIWEHSATVAVAAHLVAKEVRQSEAVAYTAGLLHDIGKVVFACGAGLAYARLTREATGKAPLVDAERNQFGFDHAQVGGALLAKWRLPSEIAVPVGCHHSPEHGGEYGELAAIIALADAMVHRLSLAGGPAAPRKGPEFESALRLLQIPTERVHAMTLQAKEEATRIKELLGPK